MKPNTDILRKALYELKHLHGITLQEATKQSDVHNLQKIIDGKIEPTPNSWWKLHKAFPKEIPEPSYVDGTRIYKNVTSKSGSITNQGDFANNYVRNVGETLSTSEQMLIDSLRRLGEKKEMVILDLLGIVAAEIKKISE